jgi:hypothetical protein
LCAAADYPGHEQAQRAGTAQRITRNVGMSMPMPPPYEVSTRPCTIHAGRFRWEIRQSGAPIETSADSFATKQEAREHGLRALERLTQTPE